MAQNPFLTTVPWEQNPMFLAAINRNTLPNGPHTYAVPRPTGNSPSDVTAFHPGQAAWSAANPPAILYQFEPTAEWRVFKRSPPPPQKIDSKGRPMWERWSKPGTEVQPLLDYAILPDQIGTQEEWWYLEAVRRLDPRIHWRDIMMRMERLNRRQKNTLNQEAVRARTDLSMLSWFPRATKFVINARLDGLLRSLTVAQIAANTTRGSTPAFLVLPASKGNHKLSPRMPTPITTLGTSAKNQKPQPGSGYIPGAGCEEANEDKLVNRNVNLHGALQGEERQNQARLYEGSNEEPYNFGRYQREANGREVGGKRAEYKINGSNGFTPGAEMFPPVLYNPSFLSVSGLEWGHGSSRGGPLWSSSREENDRSSQQLEFATPYQSGIPTLRPSVNPWNPRKFDTVRAHQTKPSPTLATSSFKRVYDEPKEYAWMPRVSNHTPHAKERRAAMMTSAHANCPLRNAQGSTRAFGRLIPNEANTIERTTNTEPYSTDLRRSFQPSFPAPIFREAIQVPVGRNAVTLAPSTRHTTSSEDGLSPSIKQQESVAGYEFDNFFDMDAYQNS